MASSTGQSVIRHLRRAAVITDDIELSDPVLLREFVICRDEGAFAALVRRHGPMVLAACRRILGAHAEVDDAFQATFMVLARKAGSIAKPALLANWLYGVSCRTALEARTRMNRCRSTQQPLDDLTSLATEPDEDRAEVLAMLDRELNRLPERLRIPVVMCELEGRSRREVAVLLGIPEGTLSSRLAAARKVLASRLTRRGIVVSAAGIGLALSQSEAPASVSAALIDSTVAAAVTGKTVPVAAAVLMKGVLTAMFVNQLQRVTVAVLILGLGTGLLTVGVVGGKSATANASDITSPVTLLPDDKPQGSTESGDSLIGGWKVVRFTVGGEEQPSDRGRAPVSAFFTKDKGFFIDQHNSPLAFSYSVDQAQKPAQIDLKAIGRGDTIRGIFEFDTDGQLKLCFTDDPKGDRPTEFDSKNNKRAALFVLKRDKSVKEPDAKEAAKLVGEAAARMQSQNNLKQMGLAMHNYLSAMNTFPARAIYDKDGKPLLSWRVAILPYLDEAKLYQEFHLDEPWDSDHNKKLIAKMPKVFGEKGTETHYRVFHGKGAIFEGKDGTPIQGITDGTSNTILIIEGPDTVSWTKPEDYEFDAEKPLPKFGVGKPFKDGFNACFADGSVHFLSNKTSEKKLRALITRNGGEIIDPNKND
jgi:RNA polymerase sigma factor (sigma-70 family)